MFGKLKKYGWLIGVLVTTISSLLGAWSTNRLIAQKLAPPEKVEGLPPPGAGARLAASAGKTPGSPSAPAPTPAPASSPAPGEAPPAGEVAKVEPGAPDSSPAPTGLDPAADAAKMALAEGGTEPSAAVAPEGDAAEGTTPPSGLSSGLLEYEIILRRNIFDHTNPLSFTGPVGGENEGADSGPKVEPLNVRLFGTVVAYPAQFSWAIMSKNENNALQETFRLGEDLYGMGTIASVLRNKVVVRLPDGGESIVELYTGQDPVSTQAAASPGEAAGGEGVRKLGENRFEIDQREITSALDNMDSLTKGARIVPSFEGGQANGFKVMRIKPDSIYNKLGIRNGDVIQRINGFELNSTEKALQMYQMLRTEKNISLDITRRGQKMTMEYSIR